ncbi:hypothetical protein CYMTET_41792 [Cymbomonas tetramitiformis]|uniref:Amine oxidase domain-containing protein n=1 Tax=Cymbomonas tetramitiformis TaxID=36881 RepID=A0AAE0F1M5_9CHLO|nr:hypothetical protein CYMTET_41792 [Cymbomonas tetramitiformis]|eukprot:gene21910-26384_t
MYSKGLHSSGSSFPRLLGSAAGFGLGAAVALWLGGRDEEAPAQRPAEVDREEKAHRVLVVGAGLTGTLTAAQLRKEWPSSLPPLHLTVWERATYPAGRFGAAAVHGGALADMGAQVLSIVDVDDDHRDAGNGGHGIPLRAIDFAKGEVSRLKACGLLVEVDDAHLGATEERMLWSGIWKHHYAQGGLVSVLRAYLAEAKPDATCFGRRVLRVARCPATGDAGSAWQATASAKVQGASTSSTAQGEVTEAFDSVVMCIPAPDALCIDGVSDALPATSVNILSAVGYDSRASAVVFFHADLQPSLRALFGDSSEIALDLDLEGSGGRWPSERRKKGEESELHLLIWQGQKRAPNSSCAVVAHSVPCGDRTSAEEQAHLMVPAMYEALSALLGLPVEELRSRTLASKTIAWAVSQMIRPMEAVVDPVPDIACLESDEDAAKGGKLVVAGDFMTQSSFLGCVGSALQASDVIIRGAAEYEARGR